MWEMMERAWSGWQNYTNDGKLVVPAIAAVIYFAKTAKWRGPKGRLMIYAAGMMLFCICPVTAIVFMKYQTAFYDYGWIWSLVPLTGVIALGGTMFLTQQWRQDESWKSMGYNTILTIVSVGVLFLCGNLGTESVDMVQANQDRTYAEDVLEQVRQHCEADVCLWAPAEVLEYARLDGDTELLYGRNMWDVALNAYSYDTYNEEEHLLYQWMEHLDDWAIEISVAEVLEYAQRGFAAGADCILLPTELSEWLPESESEELLLEGLRNGGDVRLQGGSGEREVTVLEGYYLLQQK